MAHNIDYPSVEIADDKSPTDYHYTERRAEILDFIFRAGSPEAMHQGDLADRYGVDQSQISRDIDALGDYVDEALGSRAKLTTRAAFHRIFHDLLDEDDDWKAKKAAWDVVMDWNGWLGDIGEQHREPNRSELDVDMDSRHAEVAYTVVREGDDEPLPTKGDGNSGASGDGDQVDYDDLGFTAAPADIDVTATDSLDDENESDRDE